MATSKGDFDLPVLDHISGIPAAEINATVERQIFNIGVQAFDSGSGVADIRIRWIRDGYTQNPNPVVYSAYDIGDCVFGGASLSVQQGPRADLQTSIGTCEMIVETDRYTGLYHPVAWTTDWAGRVQFFNVGELGNLVNLHDLNVTATPWPF